MKFDINGPELIIAGPGTGKTYNLIKKIEKLITCCSVESFGIIVCTFTNKAAEDLLIRLHSSPVITPILLQNKELLLGTIHSICYQLLVTYFGERFSEYEILTEDAQLNFIHSKLQNLGFSEDEIKGRSGWDKAENLASIFNLITDEEINIEKINFKNEFILEDYVEKYDVYKYLLKEYRYFDFASIQKTLVDELSFHQATLKTIQNKFKYIFVDEYQDVNNLQDKLIKMLGSAYNNITIVGDDDQSIYGFRGGNIKHILNFEKFYANKGINPSVRELLINRRSSSNIVNVFGYLINNADYPRYKKRISPQKKIAGPEVKILEFNTDEDEAKYIAKQCKYFGKIKEISYDQIAILFRSVKGDSKKIRETLLDYNIPYKLIGAGNLFQTQLGDEMLCLINLIISKHNKRLEIFNNSIEDLSILYNSNIIFEYNENNYFYHLNNYLERGVKQSSHLGLTYELFKIVDFHKRYKAQKSNVGQLTNLIKDFDDHSQYFNLFGLYSYLSYLKSTNKVNYDDIQEGVNLLTIHQAKGLEFAVVFLASQNLRNRPTSVTDKFKKILKKNSDRDSEERRVFYVGMSRAETMLYISHSKTVQGTAKVYEPISFMTQLKQFHGISTIKDFPNIGSNIFKKKQNYEVKRLFLSYNRVELYRSCPLYYFYQNVMKLSTIQISGMLYGSNVHKILEVLLNTAAAGKNISKKILENIIDKHWYQSKYKTLEESNKYKNTATEQIKYLLQKFPEIFNSKTIYSVEETFLINLNNILINGRFDLCRLINNEIEIIDFKTGDEEDYSNQLSFYNFCYEYKNKIKPKKLFVYYLKTGKLKQIHPIPPNKIKQQIEQISKKILNENFNARKGKHCNRCAYKMICEAN